MRVLFLSILLIFSTYLYCQINIYNLSLTDSTLDYIYLGSDNKIRISGITGNYSVTAEGGGCNIQNAEKNIYFARASIVTDSCQLMVRKGNKIIFQKTYRVRVVPWPTATIAGMADTITTINRLLANPFISVQFPKCFYRSAYHVSSFQAIFIRDSDSTSTKSIGSHLSTEQIKQIKELNRNDKIYFDNIRANSPDGRTIKLESFWIKIE